MIRFIRRIFRSTSKNAKEIRKLGGKVGNNFHNYGFVDTNHINLLSIGNNVVIASGAKIEMHDASSMSIVGYSKIGKVTIGDNVFIGANSIILPGITIGSNVVIGAGSVVVKDIPDNSVAVGNPCRVIKSFNQYSDEVKSLFSKSKVWNNVYKKMTSDEKIKQCQELSSGEIGFDL